MATFVPLISSGTVGPLGVLHLPRMWLKVSLERVVSSIHAIRVLAKATIK